jgi:hypothetical protein
VWSRGSRVVSVCRWLSTPAYCSSFFRPSVPAFSFGGAVTDGGERVVLCDFVLSLLLLWGCVSYRCWEWEQVARRSRRLSPVPYMGPRCQHARAHGGMYTFEQYKIGISNANQHLIIENQTFQSCYYIYCFFRQNKFLPVNYRF